MCKHPIVILKLFSGILRFGYATADLALHQGRVELKINKQAGKYLILVHILSLVARYYPHVIIIILRKTRCLSLLKFYKNLEPLKAEPQTTSV